MKPQYYTEEEKKLFLDFFIYKGSEYKKDYLAYVDQYITRNGVEIENHLKTPVIYTGKEKVAPNIYRNHWTYDSSHMLWDKHTGDNLLTYILSHKDLDLHYSVLKDLNKLHPNWGHKNKEGDTPLHILTKQGQNYIVNKLIKDFDLNPNIKNANQDYYTFLMVQPKTQHMYPACIVEYWKENIVHFEKASMDKLVEIKENVMALKYKSLMIRKQDPINIQNNISITKLKEINNGVFKELEEFLDYFYLLKVTPKKEENKKIRSKI
jgi:ankyrin repeat protein